MNEIRSRVLAIIAERAFVDVADIRLDMTLDHLGIDSVSLVESVFAIEEAFDVAIPFNASQPQLRAFDTSSIGTIIASVEALVAERA